MPSMKGPPPRAILGHYGPLQPFIEHREQNFGLASKTKSFLVSHYKGCKLPVSASQVLLPFGLNLAYYDAHEGILDESLLTLFNSGTDEFVADGQIIAAHDEHPLELTAHEFTTYQSLLTGKAARWLSMLRELGSSNLNFSLESTMHLVSYLALQVGPNSTDKILRDIHQIFNDTAFCLQLALQKTFKVPLNFQKRFGDWLYETFASLPNQSSCLERAIGKAWPDVPNGQRKFSAWRALKRSKWWMEAHAAATDHSREQVVHYHALDGHLLVDWNPIGRLSAELRDSPIVQEIFGKEHLMVFPSSMVGMEFTLACLRNGHQVHFGKFANEIAIQVRVRDTVLRLVHRQYFGTGAQADLPLPLISDCFHWLDIKSRRLEIRRRKHMWLFKRKGNWMLDMLTRQASHGQVLLVDPHSQLFEQAATVFQGFEDVERLTVFQPPVRNLSVELKRMGLDFTVNANGYLLCRELQAEIDPDQDSGTWYGLQSKIVLRDSTNHLKRSIIVPIAPCPTTSMDHTYGRYQIDDILGRLKCESEPLLIYIKSLLHALTSFPLPDTLTGRTGTEEALDSLTSAISQPWNSISPAQAHPLIALAELTPRRYYYPENMKCQQQVLWNEDLTVTIQHEQYRSLIEELGERLDRLAKFSLHECHRLDLEPRGAAELTHRSYLRRP
ncbi:hypothetical protein BJX76DRAFT_358023 [Aspergillus varians]